jgi:hypothetical protein
MLETRQTHTICVDVSENDQQANILSDKVERIRKIYGQTQLDFTVTFIENYYYILYFYLFFIFLINDSVKSSCV